MVKTISKMPLCAVFYFMTMCSATFGGLVGAGPVVAEECEEACVPVGEWRFSAGLGIGARTNPVVDGEDAPLVFLPELSYYGKRFFLNNFELGFTLAETSRHQLNALLTPGYDQMYFNRWDPLNFTSNGGVGIASSGVASRPTSRTFNIVYADPTMTDAGTSSDVSGSGSEELVAPEGSPVSPQADVMFSDVTVSGVDAVRVNGDYITVPVTGVTSVMGASGNEIVFTSINNSVVVAGAGSTDEIVVEGNNLGGDLTKEFAEGNTANAIGIVGGDRHIITYAAPEGVAEVSSKSIRKRRVAALAGLEYSYSSSRFSLHLQALQDVSGVHEGMELRTAVTVPWEYKTHQFAVTLGANWQSEAVMRYYYGVSAEEVVDERLVYKPASSALTPLLRLDWQKSVSHNWSLRAFTQYMPLSRTVKNSPLVNAGDVTAVFVGGVYHF